MQVKLGVEVPKFNSQKGSGAIGPVSQIPELRLQSSDPRSQTPDLGPQLPYQKLRFQTQVPRHYRHNPGGGGMGVNPFSISGTQHEN